MTVLAHKGEATRETNRPTTWVDWLPLAVLPVSVVSFGDRLPPWAFMWTLAFSLYAGFKWLTWRTSYRQVTRAAPWRSAAYLLAWPGMDAPTFLDARKPAAPPKPSSCVSAIFQTSLGVTLLWFVA